MIQVFGISIIWIVNLIGVFAIVFYVFNDMKTSRVFYSHTNDDFQMVKVRVRNGKIRFGSKSEGKEWDVTQIKPKMLRTWLGVRPVYRLDRNTLDPLRFDTQAKHDKLNPEFNKALMTTKIFKDLVNGTQTLFADPVMVVAVLGAGAMLGYIIHPIVQGAL